MFLFFFSLFSFKNEKDEEKISESSTRPTEERDEFDQDIEQNPRTNISALPTASAVFVTKIARTQKKGGRTLSKLDMLTLAPTERF